MFQCSDGDNWPEDTEKTISLMESIKNISQLVGYCEIDTSLNHDSGGWFDDSKLSIVYKPIVDKKLKMAKVTSKKDVWPAFSKFFGKKAITSR